MVCKSGCASRKSKRAWNISVDNCIRSEEWLCIPRTDSKPMQAFKATMGGDCMGFWWITDDLILILGLADYRSCYLVSRCAEKDPCLPASRSLNCWGPVGMSLDRIVHASRHLFFCPLIAYMGVNRQLNWHLKYGKSSRGGGSLNYLLAAV